LGSKLSTKTTSIGKIKHLSSIKIECTECCPGCQTLWKLTEKRLYSGSVSAKESTILPLFDAPGASLREQPEPGIAAGSGFAAACLGQEPGYPGLESLSGLHNNNERRLSMRCVEKHMQ
jgi:hypothetical protein